MKRTISILLLSIILIGCTGNLPPAPLPEDRDAAEVVENHPDLYLPADVDWTRTLYSGPIEQHQFTYTSEEDLITNTLAYMTEYGWELTEQDFNVMRFTKEETMTTYTYNENRLTIFIEPANLFN